MISWKQRGGREERLRKASVRRGMVSFFSFLGEYKKNKVEKDRKRLEEQIKREEVF